MLYRKPNSSLSRYPLVCPKTHTKCSAKNEEALATLHETQLCSFCGVSDKCMMHWPACGVEPHARQCRPGVINSADATGNSHPHFADGVWAYDLHERSSRPWEPITPTSLTGCGAYDLHERSPRPK